MRPLNFTVRAHMTPLERITQRVTRLGHPDARGTPTALVTLDEFFTGNTVTGSIGCNLKGSPSPAQSSERGGFDER